jgi:hypothetical protein
LDKAEQTFTRPRFSYDFSQIPVHSILQACIQAKLTVNAPGDIYEQEADRVADQVLAAPEHSLSIAPPRIQRFAGASAGQADAPASVERALASPGRSLEPALRKDMEQRFVSDFSKVRVHSDATAEQSTLEVNAKAYTVGHDIVFGAGRFAPLTHEGRKLIAHELTHVVQQNYGSNGSALEQSSFVRSVGTTICSVQAAGSSSGKDRQASWLTSFR